MKITWLSIFFTFSITLSFAQYKHDSLAIIKVLEKEAATWRSGDLKAHADCWQLRPYTKILVSTPEAKVLDIDPKIIISPPPNMAGNGGKAIFSNIKIAIKGNSAWVSHNEESISSDGGSTFSYELRLLEKVKGDWKLVGQSVHQYKK